MQNGLINSCKSIIHAIVMEQFRIVEEYFGWIVKMSCHVRYLVVAIENKIDDDNRWSIELCAFIWTKMFI